jgi:hypothetical protein
MHRSSMRARVSVAAKLAVRGTNAGPRYVQWWDLGEIWRTGAQVKMQYITNAELMANAIKAYDEWRLTAQQGPEHAQYARHRAGSVYGHRLPAALIVALEECFGRVQVFGDELTLALP